MVLSSLDQLQMFYQLYLIDLLGLLTNLRLLKVEHLIYPRLSIGFGMQFSSKSKCYGTSGQTLGLISTFLSNRQLWVVLDGKSSQEYPVNARVRQGSILGSTLSLLYINDFPYRNICNIAIYADETTFYCKCDHASDLWQ